MNTKRPKLIALTITLLLVLPVTTGLVAAQEGAGAVLEVAVRDRWGAVPGATVQVSDQDYEISERQVSDAAGLATFSALPGGTYRVEAVLDGFVPYLREGVTLVAGERAGVEARLALTRFSSSVTVSTANRREQLLLDVAEPTTLIDEMQILDTGGQSAKDVLGEQAGAGIVVHSGGGRGHVSINGVGNDGVLVLVDGRRYLGRDGIGNFNLEDLDLTNVERVEIVKGAGSALYGTDALGGVINIITKKAEPGTHNRLELTAGSHSDFRLSDSFSQREGRYGLELIGSFRTFDGYDLDSADPQTQGEPSSERVDFQGNGDYQISDDVVGRLFVNYSRRDVKDNFFAGATQLGEEIFDQQLELVRYTLSPEFDFVLSPSSTFNVTLTYGKYDRDETDVYPDRVEVVPPWQEWNTEGKASLSKSWQALSEDQLFQAGLEYRHQKMDRSSLRRPGTDSTEVDRDLNVAWFQQELNLGPKFTFTGGVRYDDDSEYGSETSPKLSAVFAASDTTRLRASYGHGFRAPRFGELFIEIPFFFVGNPDLKPETSDALTVGFTYFGSRVNASIDYFDTELDNSIVFDFGDFTPPFSYKNIPGISTRQGFNTELAIDFPGGFTPSVAYTYLDAEDDDGEDLGGTATDTAFVKLLWQDPGRGLRANLRAEYRGEETPGTSDGSFTPSYTLWNLQASKTLQVSGKKFRVWARADNLFDESDIFRRDAAGNPIPGNLQVWEDGRNYHVGVAIDFESQR
ncbi:MAG: TonB-dependent receptor [bacterium]|nr:TonB-dependent receptor [bacterium]